MTQIDRDDVVGVLLAGGLARRMGGGDKCLRPLGGRTLLEHAIDRLEPQVGGLVLNANGDPSRFERFRVPVEADPVEGFVGPLAGVLAGMAWAERNAPDRPWVVTVPTDAPLFPTDLVARLSAQLVWDEADLACAASGGRHHPVFGLWPVSLRAALHAAVVDRETRKVDVFTADYRMAVADWPVGSVDPFLNVNRPEDLGVAEAAIPTG